MPLLVIYINSATYLADSELLFTVHFTLTVYKLVQYEDISVLDLGHEGGHAEGVAASLTSTTCAEVNSHGVCWLGHPLDHYVGNAQHHQAWGGGEQPGVHPGQAACLHNRGGKPGYNERHIPQSLVLFLCNTMVT